MRVSKLTLTIPVLFALFCLGAAYGQEEGKGAKKPEYDVVHLKNGQEIVGIVTGETDKSVTIKFRGGEIELPMRQVKEIVRAERVEVEKKAVQNSITLGRYEERDEYYFVFYRGRRVGWRNTTLSPEREKGAEGYRFNSRTVFLKKDGTMDIDLRVNEFVDGDLRPLSMISSEESAGFSSMTSGVVERGHLELAVGVGSDQVRREILFSDDCEFLQPLLRRLADLSHFPEKGRVFKVYDSTRGMFVLMHATRKLRKEIVGGKHQFITVWKFVQGERSWEIWVDGYGGIVREELGGPHMVAMRADPEKVAAYARGEEKDGEGVELTLDYENVLAGFKLSRPNLTWSFEFPDHESPVAITLLNPTMQASADMIVLDHVSKDTACETIALDLMGRMNRKSDSVKFVWQRPETVGGAKGMTFECRAERKGASLRTIGALAIKDGKGYALLSGGADASLRGGPSAARAHPRELRDHRGRRADRELIGIDAGRRVSARSCRGSAGPCASLRRPHRPEDRTSPSPAASSSEAPRRA